MALETNVIMTTLRRMIRLLPGRSRSQIAATKALGSSHPSWFKVAMSGEMNE
jgi:hypothetical protein